MRIRDYSLPPGWYPRDPSQVSSEIASFLSRKEPLGAEKKGVSRCAVAPHAGWFYSGHLAAKAVSSLENSAQTIVVLGGHLPAGYPPLFALEEAVKTPFGPMTIDEQMRSILQKELDGEEDRFRDNTVEVLLPMVRHFFPEAKLLWLRLPAEIDSFEAGRKIAKTAVKLDRAVNVVASTDLTHYGRNYGFSPQGSGPSALRWVRDVNDARFISAVKDGDAHLALKCAEQEQSSCSAGAVLGAMGFAKEAHLGGAQLLEYATSADAGNSEGIPDSFVGYAAMAFIG